MINGLLSNINCKEYVFLLCSFYTCTPSTGHDSMEQEHCEVIYANDRRDSDRSTNSDNVVTGNNKIVLAKQSKVSHSLALHRQ